MALFSTAYLEITYDTTRQVLVAKWLRGVMPFELHRGYHALLEAAVEHDCRFWLLDVRRRAGIDSADILWTLNEFLPLVHPRLKRTTYLAFLMLPHHLAGDLSDGRVPDATYYDNRPYRNERFTDEEPALEWLQQCQHMETVPR
ncbi:hypothetical protein [Hymenobacter cellulosivorans]|uniref:STAS/SEC14 domain-containing protein n=1 Tax=Hymenobacter cellulosivorans TaxID=2932249 RepID=A0ABY4F361_9BACT|nr:hypothetical protein [Hymenobacter cellulosivorans]UOQ50968.1 hypothetical protein MUN80_14500 [Hymenobacter cellulosivorans]